MFPSFVIMVSLVTFLVMLSSTFVVEAHKNMEWKLSDPDNEFHFGEEQAKYAIYRLIGNDMPPLQMVGQLRWNTEYALKNEAYLPGVHERWILNRIWNETELALLYQTLLSNGVNRRDILVRCFDLDAFANFETKDDQLFYLTAQNDGRNAGIIDGRESGYAWSIILDGNTFISQDSWASMKHVLDTATKEKKYFKIPYHRVHSVQNTTWLNKNTRMDTILQYAPTKGESQIAFSKDAHEMFTLGETNADAKTESKKKGYGQRNKSYLFKDGQVCGKGSRTCACSNVFEGNEEDLKDVTITNSYAQDCGLVLRLWNYPTEEVIFTGLSPEEEEGFFYFLHDKRDEIEHVYTECALFNAALVLWNALDDKHKDAYRGKQAKAYKDAYHNIFLTESCYRSRDREIAQNITSDGINKMIERYHIKRRTPEEVEAKPTRSFCRRALTDAFPHTHYLTVFDAQTLKAEKAAYKKSKSSDKDTLSAYIDDLLSKAKKVMSLASAADKDKGCLYCVTNKARTSYGSSNKRYYYSVRPFHWAEEDLSAKNKQLLKDGTLQYDEYHTIKLENEMNPAYDVGGIGDSLYDRANIYYTFSNVTTLALAYYFTEEDKYAKTAADIVEAFFLSDTTGMLPTLEYAENGPEDGILDFKDMYYFLDALTLLEDVYTDKSDGNVDEDELDVIKKGPLGINMNDYYKLAGKNLQITSNFGAGKYYTPDLSKKMARWCGKLLNWMMQSEQGYEYGWAFNNRGVLFDLLTLSLGVYAQDDPNIDYARNRLIFRLTKVAPSGHFGLDGSQPHEVVHNSPMHFVTYNLATWVHAATVIENMRRNSEIPDAFPSLWTLKHTVEQSNKKAEPVLLKAIRWLMQYLPTKDKWYYQQWVATLPTKGKKSAPGAAGDENYADLPDMDYSFPFHQKKSFYFDRMLEILRAGVGAYGVHAIFDPLQGITPAVKAAYYFPQYSVEVGMHTAYQSTSYDSGTRIWPAIGNLAPLNGTASKAKL